MLITLKQSIQMVKQMVHVVYVYDIIKDYLNYFLFDYYIETIDSNFSLHLTFDAHTSP